MRDIGPKYNYEEMMCVFLFTEGDDDHEEFLQHLLAKTKLEKVLSVEESKTKFFFACYLHDFVRLLERADHDHAEVQYMVRLYSHLL